MARYGYHWSRCDEGSGRGGGLVQAAAIAAVLAGGSGLMIAVAALVHLLEVMVPVVVGVSMVTVAVVYRLQNKANPTGIHAWGQRSRAEVLAAQERAALLIARQPMIAPPKTIQGETVQPPTSSQS